MRHGSEQDDAEADITPSTDKWGTADKFDR